MDHPVKPQVVPRSAPASASDADLVPRASDWGRARTRPARHDTIDLRHIVVGIDGAPGAALAVEWARSLAARFGSTIRLVTVVSPPPYGYGDLLGGHVGAAETTPGWRGALEAERRTGENILEGAMPGVPDGPDLHRQLGVGSPAAYLARIARETDAGLIIIGARGTSAAERLLLGSVAQGVKRLAPTSILIAKGPPSAAPILLATDGSLASGHAVAAGLRFARTLGGPATVFTALGPQTFGPPTEVENLTHAPRAVYEDALRRTGTTTERPPADFKVGFGPPAEAILEEARESGAGLVVLGARGLSGLRGFAIGSVSDRVSHLAPCSVLLVRGPQG